MSRLALAVLVLVLGGCTSGEEWAAQYCADKGGVKGHSVRWGFPVVHCNNGAVKINDCTFC